MEDEWSSCQNAIHQEAISVEAKLKEVRQDEIGERMPIAFELPTILDGIEIFFRGLLSFNLADDLIMAVPDAKIWISGLGRFWESRHVDFTSVS